MRVLALSGSLRRDSLNTRLLRAAQTGDPGSVPDVVLRIATDHPEARPDARTEVVEVVVAERTERPAHTVGGRRAA